jgi:hypothetical protein
VILPPAPNIVHVDQVCTLQQQGRFFPKLNDLFSRKDRRHFHESVPMILALVFASQRIRKICLCHRHSTSHFAPKEPNEGRLPYRIERGDTHGPDEGRTSDHHVDPGALRY